MSIVITNISEQRGKEYGRGLQHYVLGINHLRFVEFAHRYEDGLASCLRSAADAFDDLEQSGDMKIFEKVLIDSLIHKAKGNE